MEGTGFLKRAVLIFFLVHPAFGAGLLVVDGGETPLLQRWALAREQPLSRVQASSSAQGDLNAFLAGPDLKRSGLPPKTTLERLCQSAAVKAVVTTDSKAARGIIQDCRLPLVLTGVSRQELVPLLAAAQKNSVPATAIYLEAEPQFNLRLIRAFLPQARALGLLRASAEPVWLRSLREEAVRLQFELREIVADGDLESVRKLRGQLTGLDAVLLPPDAGLINEWSLKPLLLMTVREGVPSFGALTARYVEAGVLAGVVADDLPVLDQARQLALDLARGRAAAPVYPTAVRVAINENVARFFGFSSEVIARAQALFGRP